MNFEIPQNIERYLKEHDGVNVAVNFNSASANHGYAHALHKSVVVSRLTRTCHRCGYDQLWKPDDTESRCQRHTYDAWRYDPVFAYSFTDNPMTLEECFDIWTERQEGPYKPCEYMGFGQFGWR